MFVAYLRDLTAPRRTTRADRHLAHYLTFVAGAVNAGGFLAVGRYTSHMSGIVSSAADAMAMRHWALVAGGLASVAAFVSGAAVCAWLVNWGRRRHRHSTFAAPLGLEGLLLLVFGVLGRTLDLGHWVIVPMTVALLCFVMGLQNAMVTKVSQSEIRTTHVTGMVTDIGIEVGKLVYWNRSARYNERGLVLADREKLRVLITLVSTFFVGGVVGAIGFFRLGFVFSVPLALIPLALCVVPLQDDLRGRLA